MKQESSRSIPIGPPISFDGPKWFVVMTNPQCEVRAQLELEALGYRTFMPKLRKWVTHARVKKAVERPLLSRYLFVEVDYPRQSFGPIKTANGVELLISNLGIPEPVPSHWVEGFLARYLAGEWDEVEKERLPVGARIRVIEGEFDNLLATITSIKGRKVTAKLLDTAVYVQFPECSVRAA